MSFRRNSYDDCSYELELQRSTKPGNYRLFNGYTMNKTPCYSYNGPVGSKGEVSSTETNCNPQLGQRTEIETQLTNRNKILKNSNEQNNDYLNNTVIHKPPCSNKLSSEDSRFTNPLINYRSMSLTNFHFTPHIHIPPQASIQSDKHRKGSSSRLIVKDNIDKTKLKQEFWDNGKSLPPKPSKFRPPSSATICKKCCD